MTDNSPQAARLKALRDRLEENGLDALLVSQPDNRRYLSGFKAEDASLTESSGHLLITSRRAILATDFRYAEAAAEEAPLFEVMVYKKGLAELLAGLLDGRAGELEIEKLGFESDWLTYAAVQKLTEKLGQNRLVPSRNLVANLRLIKDAGETAAMERSLAAIEAVMDELIELLRPGMSEREAAWRIIEGLEKRGCEPAFPPIVASGPNGAKPHATPTERVIAEGEPIVIDAGARLDGYCSDITRTVCLGRPDDKFKAVYTAVRKAQLAAIEGIEPGMDSVAADKLARDVIAEAGYGEAFGHSLGHGVGLATHEAPSVGPLKPVELRPGMVFTVEPGVYLPGWGGVRLEVMVELTETGLRRLGRLDRFYEF